MRQEVGKAVSQVDHVTMRLLVEDEFKYIKPLAYVDFKKEDSLLLSIKENIIDYINQVKSQGMASSASVYLRKSGHYQDIRINPSEIYIPGSLMKIPVLITYLKEAEKNPSVLQRRINYIVPFSGLPVQNTAVKSIEVGNSYSVAELLRYMIVYSDNNATALLNQNIEFSKIQKVFSHLQLPIPQLTSTDYSISLKEYSRFFRVLYNATYLSWEMSEYALNLLTQCEYKNGMMKYLAPGVKVAHKFGERNTQGEQQLHEVGIVYIGDKSYLIGIMTKGSNMGQLEEVVGRISKIVYDYMIQAED